MYLMTDHEKLTDELGRRLRQSRENAVNTWRERAGREGKLLFNGKWLSPEQVDRAWRKLKRRQIIISIELGILFATILLVTALTGYLLIAMANIH